VCYSSQSLLFFKTIEQIDPGKAAILLYTYPALVMLFGWLRYKQPPTRTHLSVLVVTIIGCLLVLYTHQGDFSLLGVALGLGTALVYSLYLLLIERVLEEIAPMTSSFNVCLGTGISMVVLSATEARGGFPTMAAQWCVIAGLVVLCTVLPTLALFGAIRRIGSAKTSLCSTIEPLVAAVLGVLIFAEEFAPHQILGAFPSQAFSAETYVGVVEALPEEQRLPGLFERLRQTIIPALASECDFLVGASSLGDLTGPTAGQPERFLRARLRELVPRLDAERTVLVSSACSSGTDAIACACALIESGTAQVVGVLAFDSLELGKLMQHLALGTQSADRARPFDVNRSGTSFGEGGAFAVVVGDEGLRRLGRAALVRIAGFGMSCDALDITAPDPTGQWPSAAIQRALASAGPAVAKIGYINAHGSGTFLNDRVEAMALREAFGSRLDGIPVSSTKGAVGHLLGATGLVEIVFATWAIRDGVCPGNTGLEQRDPEIALQVLSASKVIEGGLAAALSVTFGFGGVNSAVVLERVS
jgi:3-oxoacyl-[acyl-carrier-protein] synthase II